MDNYATIRSLGFPAVASALGIGTSKFKRKGKDWAGACPIHGSKNNVGCFRYEVDGGRWHCFSCWAKGILSGVRPSKAPVEKQTRHLKIVGDMAVGVKRYSSGAFRACYP